MATEPTINVTRTGRTMDMASSEFAVEYPDGHRSTLWSPPWHEMTGDEELEAAIAKAKELYGGGKHREAGCLR